MVTTPLQINYVDPDGINWNLSDYTMAQGYICSGIAGIEGLPVSIQTLPLLDGTAITDVYIPQPGTVALGVLVGWPVGGDQNAYYALLDKVTRAFTSRRKEIPAPGYLIIQRPDGTSRQIAVYTTSGLNTPEVGIHNTSFALTLQAPDPYWSDLTAQSMNFAISNAAGILPLLPVRLASSSVTGNVTVTNNGTAIAYPTWIITGPGTPTMQNLTTGRKWSLNAPVPAGQVVQVATKPGTQMAYNVTSATNIWDSLVLSSLRDLWGLMGGPNQINIAMAGSTLATSVNLSWTNRWSRA